MKGWGSPLEAGRLGRPPDLCGGEDGWDRVVIKS